MAHGTRINGTAYGVTGGRCLVGGTAYAIKKGRTLVGGTGYDIGFQSGTKVVLNLNGFDGEVWLNNDPHYSGNQTIEYAPGVPVALTVNNSDGLTYFNGKVVQNFGFNADITGTVCTITGDGTGDLFIVTE